MHSTKDIIQEAAGLLKIQTIDGQDRATRPSQDRVHPKKPKCAFPLLANFSNSTETKCFRSFSSSRESPITQGRCLFSLFPPAFAAVPQYFFHITVELLALPEPDKRLSHTSGSSACYSVSLRSTAWVQVFADSYLGPPHPR